MLGTLWFPSGLPETLVQKERKKTETPNEGWEKDRVWPVPGFPANKKENRGSPALWSLRFRKFPGENSKRERVFGALSILISVSLSRERVSLSESESWSGQNLRQR